MIAMHADGMTLQAIGDALDPPITRQRVRQILARVGVDTSYRSRRVEWTCIGCGAVEWLVPSSWENRRRHCSVECWTRTTTTRRLAMDVPKVYPSGLTLSQFGRSTVTPERWWAQKWLGRPVGSPREYVTRIDPDQPITPENLFIGTPAEVNALRGGCRERPDREQIRAEYRTRSVATMMEAPVATP